MIEKIEQQFKTCAEEVLHVNTDLDKQFKQQLQEPIQLSNIVRKKKNKRKPKKDEQDDEDLFLESCIAQNEQQIMSIDKKLNDTKIGAEAVIDLYEKRMGQINHSN